MSDIIKNLNQIVMFPECAVTIYKMLLKDVDKFEEQSKFSYGQVLNSFNFR